MTVLCRNPYATSDGKAYGCGQCMPCRFNRRRKWQTRIMLEAAQFKDNSFVTLTYSDECLPLSVSGRPSVSPRDLKLFLHRVRWQFGSFGHRGIRYYGVGEYGDKTERPHYHLAMFNFPNCAYGMSVYSKVRVRCCPQCELVRKMWGKGHVYLGTVERDSAGYVASYVTKGLTKRAMEDAGDDRYPPFSRMSLRPGVGGDAVWDIASQLLRYDLDGKLVDVPKELRIGGKKYPLDRYMVRRLREVCGKPKEAPQEVIDEMAAELSAVYARAKAATSAPGMRMLFRDMFKAMVLEESDGEFAAWDSRRRTFMKRRGVL